MEEETKNRHHHNHRHHIESAVVAVVVVALPLVFSRALLLSLVCYKCIIEKLCLQRELLRGRETQRATTTITITPHTLKESVVMVVTVKVIAVPLSLSPSLSLLEKHLLCKERAS